jgi:2-keto-4-pentenoate hydratase/2-oxohepta-3-ene-1,7-dioic acid hydratase in catechol pathway
MGVKILRYVAQGQVFLGRVHPEGIERCAGTIFGGVHPMGVFDEPERLLSPLDPPMVIGIGLNYRFHAEETRAKIPEHPVVFFKATGSVCGAEDDLVLPRSLASTKVDYEAELAVVIGRECRDARPEDALSYLAGCCAANDVSARDWQKEWGGSQWSRAKSFDTFCPLGPCLVTMDEFGTPSGKRVRSILNGQVMQDWTTDDMIFDVPSLIAFLSADTTLPAGTTILTGTPHGVGMARDPQVFLKPGDLIEVEVESIGALKNRVR